MNACLPALITPRLNYWCLFRKVESEACRVRSLVNAGRDRCRQDGDGARVSGRMGGMLVPRHGFDHELVILLLLIIPLLLST